MNIPTLDKAISLSFAHFTEVIDNYNEVIAFSGDHEIRVEKGSMRIDVWQYVNNKRVCIYSGHGASVELTSILLLILTESATNV